MESKDHAAAPAAPAQPLVAPAPAAFAAPILALQRTAGNQAVTRLIQSGSSALTPMIQRSVRPPSPDQFAAQLRTLEARTAMPADATTTLVDARALLALLDNPVFRTSS